ncbi:MAG: hypothetical protein AB1793_08830 [Candidatus Thermoplasmatota archaeon]
MCPRGTRGAHRREERVQLPGSLQRRLVEAAAAGFGTLEGLAKGLEVPKSSVHYYRTGRLTLPVSVMERMLELAGDGELEEEVRAAASIKDRTWANSYAAGVHREMCRGRLRLPTREELERDDALRRKAAAIVSYVMAEGSVWIKHNRFDAGMVNITFADHETDLYEHFRSLCRDVFLYDMGPPQEPGNGARAIRGFICSRFVAEWLVENGVPQGEKSAVPVSLPEWVLGSRDEATLISAVQPWFDGEGCVASASNSLLVVGQSRHTDLDMSAIPRGICGRGSGRRMTLGALSTLSLFSVDALGYCRAMCRSEVLDQVAGLVGRLGLSRRVRFTGLRLNDNGFWSASWILTVSGADAIRAADMGRVTQGHKVRKLRGL